MSCLIILLEVIAMDLGLILQTLSKIAGKPLIEINVISTKFKQLKDYFIQKKDFKEKSLKFKRKISYWR